MQAGTPIEQVSKMLGHANLRTTVDVYGNLTAEMQHEAAVRIDGLLTPRRESLSG